MNINEMTDDQYAEWLHSQDSHKLSALKEEIKATCGETQQAETDLRLISAELLSRKIEAAEWRCP